MTRYIFVTGGVVSSLGKGIILASIGKPILAYVLTGAREKAKDPVLQTPENSFKQLHFIDDLSSKRMVGMFSNEVGLSLLAVSELLTIKHKIQKNGTFKGQI